MAPICAAEVPVRRMSSAATTAMDARSRSGQSVRAMPQTAWATIATAVSFSLSDGALQRAGAVAEQDEQDG
jgi:hypothetical protein